MTEETLFALAMDTPAEDRAALLEVACTGNPELRRRVVDLLAAHERAGNFLDPVLSATPLTGVDLATPVPPGALGAVVAPPEVVAGRYRIVRPLGEGGMGVVYLAEQTAPVRRDVALKIVRPGKGSATVLARFDAERQALAVMDHPHIAKVLDGGTTEDGRPFFVMELVHGHPLTKFADDRRLALRPRLELFIQVCRAVQHAHQKGIIHRDLKPTNVLVEERDGVPVPKVIDFGVAKAVGGQLTELGAQTEYGMVVGTPEYMAPEQADLAGQDVDTRADIYALSVMLYEMLAGSTPFDRVRLHSTPILKALQIVREEEPVPPSRRLTADPCSADVAARRRTDPGRLEATVRGELDWIVLKGLEKDRSRRYESAAALAEDVRRYLADEPVTAGPPSRWYAVRKFVRRNRGPVLAAALAAALLVAGTVGTTVGMVRARDAEALAASRLKDALDSEARAKAAEADARASEARATEDRDVAREISRFFAQDLLPYADVSHQTGARMAPNPDVKLKTVLDRAAGQMDGTFANRPRIEAELRTVIGRTYVNLSDYKSARPHLERAAALAETLYPPDAKERLEVLHALGLAYMELGEHDKSVPTLTLVRDARRDARGPDNVETLAARLSLLQALRAKSTTKRPNEAEAFELLKDCERALGADAHMTYRVKSFVAQYHLCGFRDDEAEVMLREVIDGVTRKSSPDHPQALFARLLLANTLAAGRKYTQAEPLFTAAIDSQRRVYGPDHQVTIDTTQMLAMLHVETREFDRAEPLLETAYRWQFDRRGADHDKTRQAAAMLVDVYAARGKPAEVVPVAERLAATYRKATGQVAEFLPGTLVKLAAAYHGTDRLPAAESAYREAMDLLRAADRRATRDYRVALLGLGKVRIERGDHAGAEPVLKEAITEYQKRPVRDPAIFLVRVHLGTALVGQGKYPEAEKQLLDGYEGLTKANASADTLREAARRLADLFDKSGKPDRAAEWRAKARGREVAPPPRPAVIR